MADLAKHNILFVTFFFTQCFSVLKDIMSPKLLSSFSFQRIHISHKNYSLKTNFFISQQAIRKLVKFSISAVFWGKNYSYSCFYPRSRGKSRSLSWETAQCFWQRTQNPWSKDLTTQDGPPNTCVREGQRCIVQVFRKILMELRLPERSPSHLDKYGLIH